MGARSLSTRLMYNMLARAQQFMGGNNGEQTPNLSELASNPDIRNMYVIFDNDDDDHQLTCMAKQG